MTPHGVSSVEVWSDGAQSVSDGDTVFLHSFSAGWKVTGAGCVPQVTEVYACAWGGP